MEELEKCLGGGSTAASRNLTDSGSRARASKVKAQQNSKTAPKKAASLCLRGSTARRNVTDSGSPAQEMRTTKPKKPAQCAQDKARVEPKAAPYLHQHMVRKIAYWWIQDHGASGTNRLDFNEWTLEELASIVPDQSQQLLEINVAEYATVQQLADKTRQCPLLVAIGLCWAKPLLARENVDKLRVLCNPDHHQLALKVIRTYQQRYSMPPSPLHLGRLLLTSPITVSANKVESFPVHKRLASSADMVRVGQDDEADRGEAPAEKEHFRWYQIAWVPGSTGCECTGNCGSGCPGRAGGCMNPVTKDFQKDFERYGKPVRCRACTCRHPDCLTAARRPWGITFLSESFGMRMKHWKK
jgi:hypothetical protein